MKMILIRSCLKCPFSHFTLHANDNRRLHLYCGHHDQNVTLDANTYDGTIPEWCELTNYYDERMEENDD